MNWMDNFSREWIAITTELSKYDLSKIQLAPTKDDIRVVFDDRYGDDCKAEMVKMAEEMGLTLPLFYRRCRRSVLFTKHERQLLIERLNLTEEEQLRYL